MYWLLPYIDVWSIKCFFFFIKNEKSKKGEIYGNNSKSSNWEELAVVMAIIGTVLICSSQVRWQLNVSASADFLKWLTGDRYCHPGASLEDFSLQFQSICWRWHCLNSEEASPYGMQREGLQTVDFQTWEHWGSDVVYMCVGGHFISVSPEHWGSLDILLPVKITGASRCFSRSKGK